MNSRIQRTAILTIILSILPTSMAQSVSVTVTNNQPTGGFSFSPTWFAFHNGTFDAFNNGSSASAGVEMVAELGDPAALRTDFGASGAGIDGVVMSHTGLPQFTPGESTTVDFNVGDSAMRRYFSYASMFVPSNDFFFSNDIPTAVEVFGPAGNFLGPITIEIRGRNIWDAGTEIENVLDGGAFVVGVDPLISPVENAQIHTVFGSGPDETYLTTLVGVQTPIGPITDAFTNDELLATITIVPEPHTLAGLVVTCLLVLRRR